MDTYERLQALLGKIRDHYCGGVGARLARAIERDTTYVNRLFYPQGKAGAKGIGPEIMEACRNAFNLPPGFWDMHPDDVLNETPRGHAVKEDIPTYGKAESVTIKQFATGGSMGVGVTLKEQPGVIQSWDVSTEWARKNLPYFTSLNNLSIVTGFGDSMRGMFNPGDPLVVDRGVQVCDVDGVYFFRVENEGFIKRLQRIPGQGILVISENSKYREWYITPDMDFQVFAKVLKVWRSQDY